MSSSYFDIPKEYVRIIFIEYRSFSVREMDKRKKDIDPDVSRLKVTADHLLRVDTKQFLYRFDVSELNTDIDGKRIAAIGASGSGKTYLARELIRYHRKIPAWMILNPSESGNNAYGPHVENEGIIHDSQDPKVLIESIIRFKERQVQKCKKWGIPGTQPKEYTKDPSAGLVLDDIAEDPRVFNHPIFGWTYNNSRNFKSWVLFLTQYVRSFPKRYRKQFSHVFFFSVSSIKDMKEIYEDFAPVFDNFEKFKKAFMLATGKKGASFVVRVSHSSMKVEEKVFWYQHKWSQPPFKIGADWFNDQVYQRYDKKWDEIAKSESGTRTAQLKKAITKKKEEKQTCDVELVNEVYPSSETSVK